MRARRRSLFLIPALGLHVLIALLLLQRRSLPEPEPDVISASLSAVEERNAVETPPAVPLSLTRPSELALPMPEVSAPSELAADQASGAVSAAAAPVSGDLGVSGFRTIQKADYLRTPLMRYPPAAARRGEKGVVLLLVLVGEDGLAKEVSVYRGSGYPVLDEAARQAVYTAVFRPLSVNGDARATRVIAPFIFNLVEMSAG